MWVAGNLTDPTAKVVAAAAGGVSTAMAINADLIAEDTRRALDARRHPFSAASESRTHELVVGERRHGLDTLVR